MIAVTILFNIIITIIITHKYNLHHLCLCVLGHEPALLRIAQLIRCHHLQGVTQVCLMQLHQEDA